MKFGRFTFGEDKHPELDKVVDPAKQLHEDKYIVMKMGYGEISDLDQQYIAEHLDSMLDDEVLQECWSRVHIGQPIFPYKASLRAVAAEWKRTHPNHKAEAYYIEGKKLLVVPTRTGVEVYQIEKKQIKHEGTPEETVELKEQSPWLTFPATSTKRDILQLIENQKNEDRQISNTNKIREILGGKKP